MEVAIATRLNNRAILIRKNDALLITDPYEPPVNTMVFTDQISMESKSVMFLEGAIFGTSKTRATIGDYQNLIGQLTADIVAPLTSDGRHEDSPIIAPKLEVAKRIVPYYRNSQSIPHMLRQKVFLRHVVDPNRRGAVSRINIIGTEWQKYVLPLKFSPFKCATTKSPDTAKPGIYRCSVVHHDPIAESLLPPISKDLWLTHHHLKTIKNYANIVVHDWYRFTVAKSKEEGLMSHPGTAPLFDLLGEKALGEALIYETILNLPDPSSPSTISTISLLLRAQRWCESFETAYRYAENGLRIVSYNSAFVETEE